MAQALPAPDVHRSPPSTGWIVLFAGSVVAFVLGAIVQLLVYAAFGLCMESNQAACAPGTVPTWWEWALATGPTYLLWIAPSAIAGVIGSRAMTDGDHADRMLMVASIVVAIAITLAATLMWWA